VFFNCDVLLFYPKKVNVFLNFYLEDIVTQNEGVLDCIFIKEVYEGVITVAFQKTFHFKNVLK